MNKKLLIPIFMVYENPEVQSTEIKRKSSVTDICHENPRQPLDVTVLWETCFFVCFVCFWCRQLRYCDLWDKL